eukprot:gnl/MRDRNA2_/MRDRNA2_120328_c0_seq1.p1 gnl/MRDRNA2_/MRDRNA2_120328_c0~~gnl/MRDRNA2_/MRDRNA2_120328_c0_seq1.p1  ORF type:complete len:367 (+),score=83.10 gnl/MRDRNA2_/MRDRNA2_120328_c0_seq1:116-1102(+)
MPDKGKICEAKWPHMSKVIPSHATTALSPKHQDGYLQPRYSVTGSRDRSADATIQKTVAFTMPDLPQAKTAPLPKWYQRDEPEVELACKQLWAATHPMPLYIKNAMKELSKEDANNQDEVNRVLGSLMLPGMDKAIKAGGYVDWQNPQCNGETLLLRAVRDGEDRQVQYLIAQKADVFTTDFAGRSALHWAAAKGRASLVKYLLELVPFDSIEGEDDEGNTPLHLAAWNGHMHGVRLLLRAQADLEATNAKDETPFDLAVAANCHHVVEHLALCHTDGEKALLQEMDRQGNIAGRSAFLMKLDKGGKKKGKKKKSDKEGGKKGGKKKK